ncbi:hypothetical protein Taro_046455 [Colocasia esculenta]|uniref:RNase H type-1 domain-containing protein n=1 Tax=Colocasia esculenta TaxID=4460 RepID=A0A843WTU8_COLES|nr:hypothetical protein [Colocasia esculenta]
MQLAADRRLWKHAAQLIQDNHRIISMDAKSAGYFWFDVWTGDTPLEAYIPEDKWRDMPNKICTIQQAFSNPEGVHLQAAFLHCPIHLLAQFLINNDDENTWIWCPNTDGKFSTKSVWLLLQPETSQKWAALWSPYIPLKWSILLWRMIQNLLPVDETVKGKGVPLCSKCSCCSNHQEESLIHLFFSSNIATQVWADLSLLLQFKNSEISDVADGVSSFLTHPELTTTAGRLKRCTFMAVLWEIWCSRNRARFQGNDMSVQHIINRSMLSIRAICISAKFQKIPQSWLATLRQYNSGNGNMNAMVPKIVRWLTPPPGRLKLNVDGAFKMTANEAGGGGILRDHKGNMVCAFANPYHELKTSLHAEALALRDGLLMCCSRGAHDVLVETDSLNLVHIVTGQLPRPWDLSLILQKVAVITNRAKAEITHVPREGNKVADCLAEFAFSCVHLNTWDSWANLPTIVKDTYHLDKVGCPSMRP